jgi:hypothetical protein
MCLTVICAINSISRMGLRSDRALQKSFCHCILREIVLQQLCNVSTFAVNAHLTQNLVCALSTICMYCSIVGRRRRIQVENDVESDWKEYTFIVVEVLYFLGKVD